MRVKFLAMLASVLVLVSCSNTVERVSELDVDIMVKIMEDSAPSDFGYCDVSEYYRDAFFSEIDGIKDCRIFKCNESTNFNEFGIFEFESTEKARNAESAVKKYLSDSRREFESGIIYNVEEYPKFKNATLKRFDNIIVYTILDVDESKFAFDALNKLSENK